HGFWFLHASMIFCYILYSPSLNRFYIGATQDGIEQRLIKHNQHQYGNNHYTAQTSDWHVFLTIQCTDYAQATKIERHIKKMKSSVYISNLKRYPEISEKLIEKYKSI
ncbi:MAG: GIY-YIG nuclease family protein, partial [Bacteroidota bacterium]